MDALQPSAAEVRVDRRGVRGGPLAAPLVHRAPLGLAGLPSGSAVSSSGGPGSHLGPGLRAAHGEGIPGLWTAQQQNSGSWSGEFVSSAGTVTLPNVSYAGSLSAVQAGMVVPALDAGAGNEVYPLTGSDKWVRDLIGVVGGTLALIGLLARGFYVARRRRRAPPADYLNQAVAPADYLTPGGGAPRTQDAETGGRPRRSSRAGKVALLAVGVGIAGWASARFAALLADAGPPPAGTGCSRWRPGSCSRSACPGSLVRGDRTGPALTRGRRPARWAAVAAARLHRS